MKRVRVIPTLLLSNRKLVKTIRFSSPAYVGDPINALRIFNEKEVDEICVLDISFNNNGSPDLNYIRLLTSECFMPLSYGGRVKTVQQAREIYNAGVEKIIFGAGAFEDHTLIKNVAAVAGVQSVVASLDVKKSFLGKNYVYIRGGKKNTKMTPVAFAQKMVEIGVGELLLQSIERDGTFTGYDLNLINEVSTSVNIPVIASCGASSINDFLNAIQAGAAAVAAGAMFVYKGDHKAVLINYPAQEVLIASLYNKL
jgi:cyclase